MIYKTLLPVQICEKAAGKSTERKTSTSVFVKKMFKFFLCLFLEKDNDDDLCVGVWRAGLLHRAAICRDYRIKWVLEQLPRFFLLLHTILFYQGYIFSILPTPPPAQTKLVSPEQSRTY